MKYIKFYLKNVYICKIHHIHDTQKNITFAKNDEFE